MTRLRWNFASPRLRPRPWTIACTIALAGTVHALYWRDALLQRREQQLERVQVTYQAMARGRRAPVAPSPVLDRVFEAMRYPWTDVLDNLQRATSPGLDLLEISPDAADVRRIHVQGVADQSQNVFDLVAKLEADPAWTSVQLISQTKTNVDGAAQPGNAASPVLPVLPSVSPRGIAFALVIQGKSP